MFPSCHSHERSYVVPKADSAFRYLLAGEWQVVGQSLKMKPPPQRMFERVTLFQSGYLHGFRQQEVRHVRIDGSQAVFVSRRARKEQVAAARAIVVVRGWNLPVLETDNVESTVGATARKAKYYAFAPEWDDLLSEYLRSLDPEFEVLFDGRQMHGEEPDSARPPRPRDAPASEISDVTAYLEGAPTQVLESGYERDPIARAACLRHFGHACQVCDLVMSNVYGSHGDGFIHVHHRVPLSKIAHDYVVNPIADLVPVCPNCHAMLHRGKSTLDVDVLRSMVLQHRAAPS